MPKCLFCGLAVVDGREESGFTGEGPDWMVDGDFGCDESPETLPPGDTPADDEGADVGTGSHAVTEEEARRAESSDQAAHVAEVLERRRLSRKRVRDAAPDLLAALEALYNIQRPTPPGTARSQIFADARAAIAKVRGTI